MDAIPATWNDVLAIRNFSDQLEADLDANDDVHMDVKKQPWPKDV